MLLIKFLRPSKEGKERFPHALLTQRLDNLVAIRCGVIDRGRSTYQAVFFASPTFPRIHLQAAKKKTAMLQEGNPGAYWGDAPNVPTHVPTEGEQ